MSKTCWYQINPHYFRQIVEQQNWLEPEISIESSRQMSLFALIQASLGYIESLGCDGLWLMPIYMRGEVNKKGFGSPYAIKEYEINSEWGTDSELKNLIACAKERNLKVIGEYVPNHLAPDAPFLLEGGVYYRNFNNELYYDQNWTDVVKLNHSHPKVKAYTTANIAWLMRNFGFDGFRLDMAHYPLHGSGATTSHGAGDAEFWNIVLNSPSMDGLESHLIAEVYDDRTHDLYGYRDHHNLISEGMHVYDKKTHDIIKHAIKHQDFQNSITDLIYRELHIQWQVAADTGCEDPMEMPFLRIPSNHDDAPGIDIYGGHQKFLIASGLLSILPGETMLYAGEEYGLIKKPSVTGEYPEGCIESDKIELIDQEIQGQIKNTIQKVLQLRLNETVLREGELLFVKSLGKDGQQHNQVLIAMHYLPRAGELIISAFNLSDTEHIWCHIHNVYDGFRGEGYNLQDILQAAIPDVMHKRYTVENLITNQIYSEGNSLDHDLWIGLEPLEMQIIKLYPSG